MVTVTFADQPPQREPFHKLLLDYYNTIIQMNPPKIAAWISAQSNADDFWDAVHNYMPPHGTLALAHGTDRDAGTVQIMRFA